MSCPRCDGPVAPGARFCPSCGAPLHDATTAVDTVADDDASESSTRVVEPPAEAPRPRPAEAGSGDGTGSGTGADSTPTAPPPSGTATLVACPACGARNSEARMLCGRCGADLATGQVGPGGDEVVRHGEVADVAGEVDVRARGQRRRTALVVAVIVLVGALLGVAIGVWAVRAGQADDPAAPVFDEAVYPGEPVDLEVGAIGATSTRPASDETTYAASNMVDGDVTTVWSHDPATEPATEVDLAFDLEEPAWVTELLVANGAQTNPTTFTAEGRIRTALIGIGQDTVAELLLLDQDGFQRVVLPEPVLTTDLVRLVVTDTYDGDTFEEVSVSEIVFRGHLAVGEDLARARDDDGGTDATDDAPTDGGTSATDDAPTDEGDDAGG